MGREGPALWFPGSQFYLLRGPAPGGPEAARLTKDPAQEWVYFQVLSSTGHRCSEADISGVKARAGESVRPCANVGPADTPEAGGCGPALLLPFEVCHRRCLPWGRGPVWLCVGTGARL